MKPVMLPMLFVLSVLAICEGRERTLRRDKEIFREILCVLKGRTPQECIHDRGIESLIQRLQENDLDLDLERLDNPTPKFLSSAAAAAAAANSDDDDDELPPGVASKRDAFYSDWRRRRR